MENETIKDVSVVGDERTLWGERKRDETRQYQYAAGIITSITKEESESPRLINSFPYYYKFCTYLAANNTYDVGSYYSMLVLLHPSGPCRAFLITNITRVISSNIVSTLFVRIHDG